MGASERLPHCYSGGHTNWMPGLLADKQIKHLSEHHGMIDPFEARAVRDVPEDCDGCNPPAGAAPGAHALDCASHRMRKVVSYGLTSYGYDMRVANEFKVFTPTFCATVDPKKMDSRAFVQVVVSRGEPVTIPPHSFILARSVERFKMPRDVLAVVLGKSTYARCGLVVNCTPLEPAWEGHLTVEISNTSPLPAKVYADEGIAQCIFIQGSQPCALSYADKNAGAPGKYQDQPAEIITPRM